jgi:hypothetical protein
MQGPSPYGFDGLYRLRGRDMHNLGLYPAGGQGLAHAVDQGHLTQDVSGAHHRPRPVADLWLFEK